MDFKSHFDKIHSFLTPHKDLWNVEVLNCYPNSLEAYPKSWLNELDLMPDEQLWQIDSRYDYKSSDQSEFNDFI